MFTFAIIIITILFLSFAINMMLLYSVGSFYRIFVIPGVIVHELSHAFACFVTGAKVTGIYLFKKDGGEVRHGKSGVPILGAIVISTAPFIVGALAIFILSKLIGFKPINLIDYHFSPQNIVHLIKTSFSNLDLGKIKTWFSLYLITSIAVTMIPSLQDMKNMMISLILVFATIFIVFKYTNFRPDLHFLLQPEFVICLTSVLFLLIITFFLSIIIFVIASALNV